MHMHMRRLRIPGGAVMLPVQVQGRTVCRNRKVAPMPHLHRDNHHRRRTAQLLAWPRLWQRLWQRHRHVAPLVLLLLLLAWLLSACMGDDAADTPPVRISTTTATSPATATPRSATPTPVITATHAPAATTPAVTSPSATAAVTAMPTPVTSDDPVAQALLDAMPPLALFPAGWVERIETQADRGFTHGHCRMQPSMALNAHVVANGGVLNGDDISDAMGPMVNGTYQVAADDRSAELSVSIMDLSAVPIPDAGRVVVDTFLAEDTCGVWEPEPGIIYTYGDATPAFPAIGDDGVHVPWVRTIHAATPRGEWTGYTLVFAVGNRLVSIETYATDPADIPQTLVASVAQSIAASLAGTAFEPERRALLDALSVAGAEFPPEWTPQGRQVTAYPDDGLPHHCGRSLPLPEPVGEEVSELRVMTDFTALPGDRSTTISLTVMHLPTAADAQSIVAFHQTEVICTQWLADAQQGLEVAYAPVQVVVPRLGDEPLWARAITVGTTAGSLQGVALVYAVENRVVFLTSYAPVGEPIPASVLETITWKLTEALRRFPARL